MRKRPSSPLLPLQSADPSPSLLGPVTQERGGEWCLGGPPSLSLREAVGVAGLDFQGSGRASEALERGG